MWTACAIALLLLVPSAFAQDDVTIPPIGSYEIIVEWPPEPDAIKLCCFRVDASPEQLVGATQEHFAYTDPNGVEHDAGKVAVTLEPTPGDDAEIRCRARDAPGNVSANSSNAAILDFTEPVVGDLNGDGAVDILDSVLLRRGIAGLFEPGDN